MQKTISYHQPALLNETVLLLKVKPKQKYIDATLGGGGHSSEIVKKGGEVLGIDVDPDAVEFVSEKLAEACPALNIKVKGKFAPLRVVGGNFKDIDQIARENNFGEVDGILFDLGVSSHQLETAERGFSFNKNGPLDMRMDPQLSVSARELVNGLTEGELSELFTKLGEERHARRFARAIEHARQMKPIEFSSELAEIITKANPIKKKKDRIHPATKVFQALRIAVNDELNSLREALPKAVSLLKPGGRLAVISFHSLEDGIVKNYFRDEQNKGVLSVINKKPIAPTPDEVNQNPRARSAKLRVAEKL